MTPTFRLEHETVLVDYFIESVAPRHDVRENGFEYDKHFVSTDAGGFTAYLVGLFHYFLFCQFKMITFLFADGVITFSSLAKQSAQTADTCISMSEPKVVYCLAPAFLASQCRIVPCRFSALHAGLHCAVLNMPEPCANSLLQEQAAPHGSGQFPA